eukprot:CAMPEP_0179479024 /NCGR_PEP_ID=MMETSP0799-20121207/57333_1 /TAXON_ID=46947 /ORGANISM="Geminigera cryophila, Strain CCMP2564" /LENGTH=39 /DNA_ID= /DNA_START= /DNA_END= /DNA_ORIENTATION=
MTNIRAHATSKCHDVAMLQQGLLNLDTVEQSSVGGPQVL